MIEMIIEAVELNVPGRGLKFEAPAANCQHEWEPHLWEHGRAYCARCGSFARWINDPRLSRPIDAQ
jgi:hypothetical protein